MTRAEAFSLLDELGNSPNMKKHGVGVGIAMAGLYDFFKKSDRNPEMTKDDWEIVGLLHDADYEATNKDLEKHTEETTKKLRAKGVDAMIIRAIRGHCDKEERDTMVAKSVYAVDELVGLVIACALVQPDRKLSSLRDESVMKKFKDKSFAKGADRTQILTCEAQLALPIEKFAGIVLASLQENAEDLGL